MIRRVTIEKLAPTGEGVARTESGVGFIAGTLPGEEVDAQVTETRSRFWRGNAVAVLRPSPHRRPGPSRCGGCDWAHFDLAAALESKRSLFLETMERIGRLPADLFGKLPATPSPPGYRLRNRFHVSGRGKDVALGYFAPRTHRVEPVTDCGTLSAQTLSVLPRVREAVAVSGVAVTEVATLETVDGNRRVARVTLAEQGGTSNEIALLGERLAEIFEGLRVEDAQGASRLQIGETRLPLIVGGREFPVSVDVFFQGNRYLAGALYQHTRQEAERIPPATALDAFAGIGFFAAACLEAGHAVVSVEGSRPAARDAARARRLWNFVDRWQIVWSPVLPFLDEMRFRSDLVVADPPRARLKASLARALAQHARERLLYISCEPATLARDLPLILSEGFRIAEARLYDLFAFTHRIEAVVSLVSRRSG